MTLPPGGTERGPAAQGGFRWRRWIVVLHRDVGYVCAGLTVLYAFSGIAVNHIDDWNPNYGIVRESRRFEPIPVTTREEMAAQLVDRLALDGPPRETFRSRPDKITLFYDGFSVEADVAQGTATIERARKRPLLFEANFLHLNRAGGLWTWVADLYAAALALLACTGIFILRGRLGLGGRGKWLVTLGLLVPIVFLAVLVWL